MKKEYILPHDKKIPLESVLVSARGITLISLIITIIILLILAGITISLTIGQGGILDRAKEAKMKQEIAQYEEKIELSRTDVYAENLGKITLDKLINKIYENSIVPKENIIKLNDEQAKVTTVEGYVFLITVQKTEYFETLEAFENSKQAKQIKKQLAQVITEKGVPTNEDESFDIILNNLQKIKAYTIEEGQTNKITVASFGSYSVSIPLTNHNGKIPIIYISPIEMTGFAFYHTDPVVTNNQFSFVIWNGSGSTSGSAIVKWKAIYLTQILEEKQYQVDNLENLKSILAQSITDKGIETQENMTIEEILANLQKIKTYKMETGETSVGSIGPNKVLLNVQAQFTKQYEERPIVVLQDKNSRGLYHSLFQTLTNTGFSYHIWNPSKSNSSASTVYEWKALWLN